VEQIRESVVANELDLQKAPHLEAIQKCMSMNWDAGRTHRGDIVTIGWPGQAKVGLLLETVPDEDWLQNVLYNQERNSILMDRESHEKGYLVRTLRIMNLGGIGPSSISREMRARVQKGITVVQTMYPESLSGIAVIQAPSFFTMIWAVFRPMLNEKTASRTKVLGADYKTELQETVQLDVLRILASKEADQTSVELPEGSVCINAWAKVEVPILVSKGDAVSWEFTCNRDGVMFYVSGLFQGADSSFDFVPMELLTAHEGSCTAPEDGVISVVFDNTRAWMRSRTATYNIQHASK